MRNLEQVVTKAREILVACYDEPDDIQGVQDLDPKEVLIECREMAMEDLAERPNFELAEHLADIDWALQQLSA
ncbi:hypothetical protein [Dietzia cercidiphylli]|uniref:hypothetical protein n=1 Tax=Dietzia cercidiphylli TaxID=498199 RepID=UPI00223A7BB1|nr:hypothetical protein [Dietzia cercidiphylli]MCT1516582.1 hypothetical protein [Dietzia cercidiphylli]